MLDLAKGRYRARIAVSADDLEAAQRLRTLAFRGPDAERLDRDDFDQTCTHVLIEDIG